MISEAIILAGGLGTRLRSVVSDVPKCMAPVAGKPFLHYVIAHLLKEGLQKFVFSVGYRSDSIIHFIQANYSSLQHSFSIEKEPLGTGGAIQLALKKTTQDTCIICNGDTLFSVNINQLESLHFQKNAECTLCLKPMDNFERYGAVNIDENNCITSFKEKQFYKHGYINGGVYALNKEDLLNKNLPKKFSFEKEYLEKFVTDKKIYGLLQNEYFIDIGIPEDYEKAQHELKSYKFTR